MTTKSQRFMMEQNAESKDEFDEHIHLPFYTTKTNKKINLNSKHRPSPPQHAHNVTESTLTQSSYQSNTTIVTDPTTTTNTHISITPNQWRFIKHKMDNISSFIENNENVDNNQKKQHIDKSILLQKHDDHNDNHNDNESYNGSDHISDDDVLSDVLTMSTNKQSHPLNSTENQTISTLTTSNNKKSQSRAHQYKQSMTQPFDPNSYDGVIQCLDVLQNYFNINEEENHFDIESKNESDATSNSDDEVLDRDFERNNDQNRDPFDTDASDESHDIVSNHYTADNIHVKNKHSEYDKLAFNIANSTHSRSRSVHSNVSHTGSKNTEKHPNVHVHPKENTNLAEPPMHSHLHTLTKQNKTEITDKNTKNSGVAGPSGHHRVVTPIPVNRLKSKKYRLKSPKSVNNNNNEEKSSTMSQIQINDEQMAMVTNFRNKNTISFSEILSEANKRNYNITPQSQYLMATSTHLVIDHSKALSPSHSARSQTEISVDNADEYDYRMMADGGCKRMSQSYGIPPVEAAHNTNNNIVGGSRELSTVDIIMEEDENESDQQHMTGDIGVLLGQPSVPSPPPPQAPIIDNIIRLNSLGPPPANNTGANLKSLRSLSSHYDTQSHAHNKRYNAVNKMDEDDEELELPQEDDMDADIDEEDEAPRTLITVQSIDSPVNYKYNPHQRDTSMVVEYDEQSSFQDDFVSTNYTPSNNQNPHKEANNNNAYSYHPFSPKIKVKVGSRGKSKKTLELHLHEREEEISLVQASKTKSKSLHIVERSGHCQEEDEMKCNMRRPYTQYAVRPNSEKNNDGEEHGHSMVVIHQENGYGGGRKQHHYNGERAALNRNKWTKWIILAALSICFILGVFMGFGVSWIVFVND